MTITNGAGVTLRVAFHRPFLSAQGRNTGSQITEENTPSVQLYKVLPFASLGRVCFIGLKLLT